MVFFVQLDPLRLFDLVLERTIFLLIKDFSKKSFLRDAN